MSITMLDLFSGTGGASAAMKDRGWRVVRVDIEEGLHPDVVADVTALPLRPFPVDLIWASPTCTYYSRYDQKGLFPNEPIPDDTLYQATRRIIDEWHPRFWCIENVRGAARFWGPPCYRLESVYLWTNLPILGRPIYPYRKKHNRSSGNHPYKSALRGAIPYAISEVVANAVEYLSSVAVP